MTSWGVHPVIIITMKMHWNNGLKKLAIFKSIFIEKESKQKSLTKEMRNWKRLNWLVSVIIVRTTKMLSRMKFRVPILVIHALVRLLKCPWQAYHESNHHYIGNIKLLKNCCFHMFQQNCPYHPTQNASASQEGLCLKWWNGCTILVLFHIQAFDIWTWR